MKLGMCLPKNSKNFFMASDPEGKMNTRQKRQDFPLPTVLHSAPVCTEEVPVPKPKLKNGVIYMIYIIK